MAPKNECTPQNVYGPYEQTLFLGCSVLNFSATAGWNGQTSELTVDLAQDVCDVPSSASAKKYWAQGKKIFTSARSWTKADPGFTYPNIGAPAYFRVADFEFTGLIQAWTEKKGADGLPVFSVKLIDPRPILDHAKVILDSYQGTNFVAQTTGPSIRIHNVFNVYSYLEEQNSLVNAVDDFTTGVGLGSPLGKIGGSYKTDAGISWSLVKKALQDLIGGAVVNPAPNFSTGGVAYVDGQNLNYTGDNACRGGEIYMGESDGTAKYIIDLDELPDPYTWDYRITGPVISLSQIIDQVCADAGVDYYVQLLPTAAAKGSTDIEALVIKIRTIARTNQPTLGAEGGGSIKDFINANSIENGGQGIISNSFGRELRSEVNSSFIIGGKARQYYEETNQNYIEPFWGYDADGNLIQSDYTDFGTYAMRLDFAKINLGLSYPVITDLEGGRYGWVYETQLRYALGDYDSFINNLSIGDGTTVLEKYFAITLTRTPSRLKLKGVVPIPQQGVDHSLGGRGRPSDEQTISGKSVHNWLNQYAADYYGRQFLVSIPSVSYAVAGTNWTESSERITKPIYTDEPSTEGGWPSTLSYPSTVLDIALGNAQTYLTEKSDILGIENPSLAADFFKDEQGKVQPILGFYSSDPNGLGIDNLGLDDYVSLSGLNPDFSRAWVKADMNEEWIIGNPRIGQSAESYNYVSSLLTIPAPISNKTLLTSIPSNTPLADFSQSQAPPTESMSDPDVVDKFAKGLGLQGETVNPIAPLFVKPITAGIPLKSNTRTYGPWVMMGANPGGVNCEVDESLVPWEYGSIDYMNAAGVSKVQNSVTALQVGERGEVSVPGYPTISLGSALESNPRSFRFGDRELATKINAWPNSSVGIRFVVGEAYTRYNDNVSASRVSVGSSISSINISVGSNGVTTSYTVNTFTPVFGRFSKNNSERIKNLGLRRFNTEREFRSQSAMKRLLRVSTARNQRLTSDIGQGPTSPRSPAIWFAGQLLEDKKRKVVLAPTRDTMSFFESYDNTAVVTMDNFFRPVSIDGGGGSGIIAGSGLTLPRVNLQGETTTYDKYRIGGYAIGERVVNNGTGYIANTTVIATVSPWGSGPSYPAGAVVRAGDHFRAFLNVPGGTATSNNSYWENLDDWMTTTPTVAGIFDISKWNIVSQELVNPPASHTQTSAPFPPLKEYSGLAIRQKYLNYLGDPYKNNGLFDDVRSNIKVGGTLYGATSGHDVEGVARKSLSWLSEVQGGGSESFMVHRTSGTYASDYRFLAHRGPLVVQGWGYDINGKPIPNASGDESAHLGDFSTSYVGLTDRFQPNWLSDATTWPVAPVDLRFDRKRGVWTIPPAFRMYQVQSVNAVSAGADGTFSVLKSKEDIADADGLPVSDPTVEVENWTDSNIAPGTKNLAYYDTAASKYWLVGGGGGGGGGGSIVAGISRSGSAAVWRSSNSTWQDGYIEVYSLTQPDRFESTTAYSSGDQIIVEPSGFSTSVTYLTGDRVIYSGNTPNCPDIAYRANQGISAGSAFVYDEWDRTLNMLQRFKSSGVIPAGNQKPPGGTGWELQSGTRYLDTDCVLSWSHGMTTPPEQGHYTEGQESTNILVWYDCNRIPGWRDISI